MTIRFSRRNFLGLLGTTAILPFSTKLSASPGRNFRIRTITAGVKLADVGDMGSLQKAVDFLQKSRKQFTAMDYEVQTLRIATQPLVDYLPNWRLSGSLDAIKKLDAFAREYDIMFNIGPVNNDGQDSNDFVSWVAEVISNTTHTSCSFNVASAETGIGHQAIDLSSRIMSAIASSTKGGEGNFRFAASAFCPPGTPFFPASYYYDDAFSIGLESADLLQETFAATNNISDASKQLKNNMEAALQPIEAQAEKIARQLARPYLGIDTSPAPNLDVSIARAIETLSGQPFGSASTLSACAVITDVLKSLDIKSCGYSGLMLPILEDTILARRAMEGRYSISDLLLFSSVCGTGLDVVPLPGDVSVRHLAALVGDVAALATKYSKPLSARLFPVPGKKAGDIVTFDNPYLTDSVVMKVD
jgi:uncharacterized protein